MRLLSCDVPHMTLIVNLISLGISTMIGLYVSACISGARATIISQYPYI